jgi:hypothetical protein
VEFNENRKNSKIQIQQQRCQIPAICATSAINSRSQLTRCQQQAYLVRRNGNSSFLLQAFLNLQKCVAKPEIAKLISKFGMITIPLFQLMAFAEVGDDEGLILYEVYIRKSLDAMVFRSLVALSHSEYPRGRDRKFTFNLIIDSREINKLRIIYQPQSPELMPLLETPEVAKSTRITNKVKYASKYQSSLLLKNYAGK